MKLVCVQLISAFILAIVLRIRCEDIDVKVLARKIQDLEQEVRELKHIVKQCTTSQDKHGSKRFLLSDNLETGPVAFSAYVSDYKYGLGPHQIIPFDGVLLNDGNAYNNSTGVFTVPVTGVYLVSYFIADRDVNQVFVQLTVDNVEVSMACAETIQSRHIDQGGNLAILHLNKGQNMWVEVNTGNAHIEGHEVWRFTTFSALLLYQQ